MIAAPLRGAPLSARRTCRLLCGLESGARFFLPFAQKIHRKAVLQFEAARSTRRAFVDADQDQRADRVKAT